MKRIVVFIICLLAGSALLAQQKETPKTKEPPVLSSEWKLEFFKAQAQVEAARIALEPIPEYQDLMEKQKVLQQRINEGVQKCGADFTLQLIKNGKPDKDGEPACVTKPEPPKATEPAKK